VCNPKLALLSLYLAWVGCYELFHAQATRYNLPNGWYRSSNPVPEIFYLFSVFDTARYMLYVTCYMWHVICYMWHDINMLIESFVFTIDVGCPKMYLNTCNTHSSNSIGAIFMQFPSKCSYTWRCHVLLWKLIIIHLWYFASHFLLVFSWSDFTTESEATWLLADVAEIIYCYDRVHVQQCHWHLALYLPIPTLSVLFSSWKYQVDQVHSRL
jgi:hypothetical protein